MLLTDHSDGCPRCAWPGHDPVYVCYHDEEWGVPEYDDRALFEKLILDGFQAGLSWITILRKREGFRSAFAGFEPEKIVRFTPDDVERLMLDASIIRNRAKIVGTIKSAGIYLDMKVKGESFSEYLWSFQGGAPIQNTFEERGAVPTATPLAEKISKDLKKRGFTFVGPTIIYAFMQAVGMVNDHMLGCYRYAQVQALTKGAR